MKTIERLDGGADAYGEARRWLEANPEHVEAADAWIKANQQQAWASPDRWTWLKEQSKSGRLGDEAEAMGAPRGLLIAIEDEDFGRYPGSGGLIGRVRWACEQAAPGQPIPEDMEPEEPKE